LKGEILIIWASGFADRSTIAAGPKTIAPSCVRGCQQGAKRAGNLGILEPRGRSSS
jgi:hypothetical protein